MSKTWKDKEFKKLSRIHTRPEVILKPHPTKTELLQEGELEDSNGWFDDEDFYEYGQVEEA